MMATSLPQTIERSSQASELYSYASAVRSRRADTANVPAQRAGPLLRTEEPVFRAGFGKGTVSGTTAAFYALDRGVDCARRLIPTREELLERQREQRRESAEETQYRNIERRTLEAAREAKSFINRLNEVAGQAQEHSVGRDEPQDQPPVREDRTSLEINGKRFEFRRPGTRFTLDLRV